MKAYIGGGQRSGFPVTSVLPICRTEFIPFCHHVPERNKFRSTASPRGFTLLETIIVLGVLATAMTLVAEVGYWTLQERARSALRLDALEFAASVLESARAAPWEDLTPAWAARQQIPESLASRLPQGRLTVRVEPEAQKSRSKRVTVELHWNLATGGPARPVQLVGVFTARSATTTGGKP
jgi:prepilin-type N-terminal cleavage/methylation domain-containing protein